MVQDLRRKFEVKEGVLSQDGELKLKGEKDPDSSGPKESNAKQAKHRIEPES